MSAALHVDLDLFAANLARVRQTVSPSEPMLVVKNDAYGHGLVPIVRRAAAEGVRWFGAFDVGTGRVVRRELGEAARIFVWMTATADDAVDAVHDDLDIGVGDDASLEDVAAAARTLAHRARVHLKIDTGLHRNGVRPEEWPAFVARVAALVAEGLVEVVGVWSHIAEASDVDGVRSAGGIDERDLGVRLISSLRAEVTSVDDDGAHIGLGALDGLPSTLGGRVEVLTPAGVRRLESVGEDSRIAAWPSASVGDAVTVFGGGDNEKSPTDLAEAIGSVGEEILVRLSPLVPRLYEGRVD